MSNRNFSDKDKELVIKCLKKTLDAMEKILKNEKLNIDFVDTIVDGIWTSILQAHLHNNIKEDKKNHYFNYRIHSFIEKVSTLAHHYGLTIESDDNPTIH